MPTSFTTFNPGDLIEDTHVEQFITPIQNLELGNTWYAQASGAANAFEVDLVPAPTAYTEGMIVHFRANNDNTGVVTLDVNGLGTKSLVKEGGTSLVSGDIIAGQMVAAIYDGGNFQLLSPAINLGTAPTPPTTNVLVYADVTPRQVTGTFTNLSLPSFTFDSGKSYLMEVTVVAQEGSGNPTVRVTLSDGTTSYAYPGASDVIRVRYAYEGHMVSKKLPNLSGSHTVVVSANNVGHVMVKLYEIYDNLVYADFSKAFPGATIATQALTNFTATSGHTYLLKMTTSSYTTTPPSVSCYLDDGSTTTGIPQSGPTSSEIDGPAYGGGIEVCRVLTGLSGSCTVTARGKYAASVGVLIYDIT